MKVCVQGLWHLGSVTAACLASVGHDVVGLDADQRTIDGLSKGKAALFEPGLDDLLQSGIAKGRLRFTTDITEAAAAEVFWVAFDTPVDEDDHADVEFVLNQIKGALPVLADGAVVLVSSQMPVGSIRKLEGYVRKNLTSKHLSFAFSPENLRLGQALDVFLKPDRIVVGVRTDDVRHKMEKLLFPLTDRIEWMSVESAEMTKHALNGFLATSITFINEIATLCERVGADAKEVERALKSDGRIGSRAYLSPGAAFAGGTLARDIRFLIELGATHHQPTHLVSAVQESNNAHKGWARRTLDFLVPSLYGQRVAVWGLTYKAGTDTLRRSASVELCLWLTERGADPQVHDPAIKALPGELAEKLTLHSDPIAASKGAVALLVATEWPVYQSIGSESVVTAMNVPLVIDPNRFLLTNLGHDPRIRYVTVGEASR